MERFRCASCGNVLSLGLRRVPLPPPLPPALLGHGYPFPIPRRMDPLTYGVDDDEYGRHCVAGTFVLSPGDVRGMHFVYEWVRTFCWSLHGGYGPNMACDGCGTLIGCRTDDCETEQETRFYPDLVVVESCGPDREPAATPFELGADWDDGPDEASPWKNRHRAADSSRPRPELALTLWRIRSLRDEVYRDDPPA